MILGPKVQSEQKRGLSDEGEGELDYVGWYEGAFDE